MKRRSSTAMIGLATIMLFVAGVSGFGKSENSSTIRQVEGHAATSSGDHVTYAQIALWDVSPGQSQAFESGIRKLMSSLKPGSDFINARVLKNLNELNLQYATYVRYENRMIAEDSLAKQVSLLGPLCWRKPETHLIKLERAYSPAGVTDSPTGNEFVTAGTGQIAHLGLFVPYPRFRKAYDQVLDEVKVQTQEQKNAGYIGEEIGSELQATPPEKQTPYSPRPTDPASMSINYGEYKTFEQAEATFLAHTGDRLSWGWWRIFFSSLQVPTRFYIFRVVQSYGRSEAVTGSTQPSGLATSTAAPKS